MKVEYPIEISLCLYDGYTCIAVWDDAYSITKGHGPVLWLRIARHDLGRWHGNVIGRGGHASVYVVDDFGTLVRVK